MNAARCRPDSPRGHARRRFALALVGLLAHVSAARAEPAQRWLEDMYDATRHSNYEGVFVYQRGAQLDAMRLVHRYDGEVEQERLISLSGPAREVIRDGTLVTCMFSDDQAAMVEKNAPRDLIGIGFSAPIDSLHDSYHFVLEGNDRVAGRHAAVVAIVPHREDRYGYRLWIDAESKLLLKSVILARGGRVLEQVQFTHIAQRDAIDPALLRPEIAGSGFTWRTDLQDPDDAASASGTVSWQVQWMPDGFEMRESDTQHMATSHAPVDHLVYSDGLAMVSVFVERLMQGETPLQGYSARGAVNAFSRVEDEHQITVVGELPLPTVRQIATSVTRIE
ncbi:MAG: MucB/RseB C-terminal domain-containing protein [Gammaproteobacteria bacterium]